jgi:hypothetical protein
MEDHSNERVVETRSVRITLRADGIAHVYCLPGIDQEESDAGENLEVLRELLAGRKTPLLIDIRETGTLARQARRAYAANELGLAQALVVGSAFSRVGANLFLRLARPAYPTRLFTTEDDALRWLRGRVL